MNKLAIIISGILVLGIILGLIIGNSAKENSEKTFLKPTPITKTNCLADDCLLENVEYPAASLPDNVVDALHQAISDEYKAYATYKSIIDKFGNIRPFIMVINAEQQHITALEGIYNKYGIEIPKNNLTDNVYAPFSIKEACAVGVDAEIKNVNLYKNHLIPMVSDYPDITSVFLNLMNASEQKHLPAFMKCD